jgi:cupin fold WbuC family metalloprotein
MIEISNGDLSALVAHAQNADRRRHNLNIHSSPNDPINRLLNAVEPGSYVRPHRHPDKVETLVAVAGRFELLFFDDSGRLSRRSALGGNGAVLIEYPTNTWHSLIALESASVFFEVKAGPYLPVKPEDYLPGWPLEQSPGVALALDWLHRAAVGDTFPHTIDLTAAASRLL